jgi:hypothetical protein
MAGSKSESCNCHFDYRLDGWRAVNQDIAAVVNKDLNGMEGVTEAAGVLVIKDTGDYLKHFLLTEGHLSAPTDERSESLPDYVRSRRMSSSKSKLRIPSM